MTENHANDGADKKDKHNPKTFAGMLTTALDIEEHIAGGVYEDYLTREIWPEKLEDEIFETIKGFLNTLINDTKKHKQIIARLIEDYGCDHES